jgi:hypothetical protein
VRRVLLTVMFAVSFIVGHPAPAHAWWHWLDELSGPGPFMGAEFQWRLACIDDPAPLAAARQQLEKKGRPGPFTPAEVEMEAKEIRKKANPGDAVLRSLESFHPGKDRLFARLGGAGCVVGQNGKTPIASLNLRTALLGSVRNHLDYGGRPSPHVFMFQPELSVSRFVDQKKHFELATGAGGSRASGDGFEPLWRFYWKPVIVTFTPAPLVRCVPPPRGGPCENTRSDQWTRAFSITGSVQYMPRGFTAADFGAQGTYNSGHEWLAYYGIVFDLSRF